MSNILKGYINTPNGQIHYRKVGMETAPPLVLLHQTASSGMMFEGLMGLLLEDYWLIAPDTPGFGASFSPPSRFSVKYLADSLHTALMKMGVESCFMFGHHTGAALAVQMAFDFPHFIKKLILSGPPLLNEAQVTGLKASLRPFELAEDGSHLSQVWERIRKRDAALPLEVVQREVLLTQAARDSAQDAYQAVFNQPFAEQLAGLEMPILVIAGENDTLRASLEPAYQLIKNGEMQVLAGAGPYVVDQNPQVLAKLFNSFYLGD